MGDMYDGKEVLNEVMTKMFSYVGATYEEGSCKEPGWYLKYEWTEEQEEDFRQWFIATYKANPRKFNAMYGRPAEEDSRIEESAGWFIIYNGWKTKKH